jgi:membrane-bound serine protease (ClpP class)
VIATRRACFVLLALLGALLFAGFSAPAQAQGHRVLLATVDGAIDRSTVDYMREAIEEARSGGYAALIVRFDTPGGALAETLEIAALFNNARDLPILGWVGPVGAHAWSAGTVLLVSTDLAAMATGTTIGSVAPVEIGPGGVVPVTDEKVINAVVGAIREELMLHGRNESLADAFVRDNLNLNAGEAVSRRATELVAEDPGALADLGNGRTLVYKGLPLATSGSEVVTFSASPRVRLLVILSNPLVASLLLVLGIYLVIFSISAPGHGGEIAGIIILLLALVGLGFSVDPIALLLFLVGIILILLEIKTPGFGAFGIGGLVAIVLAAAFLAPLRPPRFVVSPDYQIFFLAALLTPTGFIGGFLLFALYKVQQVRHQKPRVGEMLGESATVVDGLRAGERGYVKHRGELWQAIAEQDMPADAKAFIHSVEGITLHVSSNPPPAVNAPPLRNRFLSFLRRRPREPQIL